MGLMGIRLERNKGVKLWALGDFNRVWIRPIGALPGQAWFPSVQCICQIYGYRVDKKEALPPLGTLKCSQIYSQYHEACVEERGRKIDFASGSWYSCYTCQEVYLGLQGQSGLMNLLHDGA